MTNPYRNLTATVGCWYGINY